MFQRLYYDHPQPADLVPLDEATATEIRVAARADRRRSGRPLRDRLPADVGEPPEDDPQPAVGEPRASPELGLRLAAALTEWMEVENLEARMAASGWIDRRVLKILRTRQADW